MTSRCSRASPSRSPRGRRWRSSAATVPVGRLLKCLVGAERCDVGEMLLDGVVQDEASTGFRALVVAVLDDADYFPDISVVEHLRLLAWLHGAAERDVLDVVSELGLTNVRDQLPPTLSSGQRHLLWLSWWPGWGCWRCQGWWRWAARSTGCRRST